MPIKIPNNLPAIETLRQENIFCMTETRADTQDIRPLKIILLNLMPTKIDTETQFTRLLGNTPLQVELTLVAMSSHESKNTTKEHMIAEGLAPITITLFKGKLYSVVKYN